MFHNNNPLHSYSEQPSELLEEFILELAAPSAVEVAQGIPVGEDPNLPMSQDQFRDWVNRSRDLREGRLQQFLERQGPMSDYVRRTSAVRGI